jgi:hypothetical protein
VIRLWPSLACILLSAASLASAQSVARGQAQNGGPAFVRSVRAFVTLRHATEASLPVQTAPTEADRRVERQKALARSLIAARRGVRQGDVFGLVVAARCRAILRAAFAGPDGADIRRTLQEGDPATLPFLRVNDLYPENSPFVTMPPTLLRRLPALPMELAYRIIGTALVLKDVETNVIVDVLVDAVPIARR